MSGARCACTLPVLSHMTRGRYVANVCPFSGGIWDCLGQLPPLAFRPWGGGGGSSADNCDLPVLFSILSLFVHLSV